MRAVRAAVGEQSRGRRRLTSVALGLVVGLLGMYALCTPGACATGSDCPEGTGAGQHLDMVMTSVASVVSVAAVTTAEADLAGLADVAAGGTRASAQPLLAATDGAVQLVGHDGHGGHEHGSAATLAMMCLAVLAAVLALLWPALTDTRGLLRLLRPTSVRLRPTRPLRDDGGPPDVWQFSVIRC